MERQTLESIVFSAGAIGFIGAVVYHPSICNYIQEHTIHSVTVGALAGYGLNNIIGRIYTKK